VYCTPGIREAFVVALAEAAETVVAGDGMESGTTMGPVVSQPQLDKDPLRYSGRARPGAASRLAAPIRTDWSSGPP